MTSNRPALAVRRSRAPRPARTLLALVLGGTLLAATPALGIATAPPAVASSPRLSWAPPTLTDPITIDVTSANRDLRLAPGQDYVLRMPSTPLSGAGGLIVNGGDDVVLIGGEITIPSGVGTVEGANRGLYLRDQTGTVHVEGLRISGAGLGEGINLSQPHGAVVQLQNIRVETVHGSQAGHHADVIQTWNGPRELRVDGLSGATTYQGLFLLPQQHGAVQPQRMDLRRVDLRGTSASGYMVWRDSLSWPLTLSDVWVQPSSTGSPDTYLWPRGSGAGTQAWPSVAVGVPPGGQFVPSGLAGTGYVSPGYTTTPSPLRSPVVGMVTGARAAGGTHYTRDSSVELTWAHAGPAVTGYEILRGGTVVATAAAPATRTRVPVVAGSNDLTVRARSASGQTTTSPVVTVVRDTVAPTVTRAPEVTLRTGALSASGTAPITVQWEAQDDVRLRHVSLAGTTQGTFEPARTVAYGSAAGLGTWTAVAEDEAGNTRSASTTRTVSVVRDTSMQRTGTWSTVSGTAHHGGAALRSETPGSALTHTFTGRAVALVAQRRPDAGRAVIYVDGARITALDLNGPEASQQVVWNRSWPSSAERTIRVEVEGTSGRPGITVDGVVTVG
ncbi:hypothetical protein J4G33_02340 [Actinotalea sp. BY-33]|uniref:Uncharacterized protein n=1 Tax=Actinotalea soli TaxID=2819234 RepID=A0A939RUH0_9CELL|nr:hypothetical protein [Actinotalea soli]MBO1750638.1 hypothetical protein [Actinotalea soli]